MSILILLLAIADKFITMVPEHDSLNKRCNELTQGNGDGNFNKPLNFM